MAYREDHHRRERPAGVHIETPGELGQTRQTWRDKGHLRGLLLQIVRQNPTATREQWLAIYHAEVSRSPALSAEARVRCFDNDLRGIQRKPGRRLNAADVSGLAERIANVVLLDWLMPNGKRLRDCTGRDCKKAGGWLIRVGERIGDRGIVGKKLSEAELAAIRAERSN